MRTWVRQPKAILASDADGGLVIEEDRIVECLKRGQDPSESVDHVFDARDHVVIPGLINTHHHFYQTLTRAHPDAINLELFPWLKALYPIWSRLDPESFRLSVRLAMTELLMSGCTTAADHHYVFPAGLEQAVDIEAEEARCIGMRMTISRGSMNLSVKDGGLPPDSVVQDQDSILADCERVLGRYHETSTRFGGPVPSIQIALSPCSPFSVTPQLMKATAELAERFDCRLHTHLAETKDENNYCLEVMNKRPLDLLEDVGWLSNRVWLAHGIHFSDDEYKRLGHAGTGVSHCPTSNAILASGFCPVLPLEAFGVPVGLGVDGSASNDSSNMMEAVRHALMVNRLREGTAATVTHLDALRWATEGSAACLGRSQDLGRLAVGYAADMALFLLDDLRFSGAHDPLAALVLCGAHHADRVMIGGQWRLVDGLPLGLDLDELRYAHGQCAKHYT